MATGMSLRRPLFMTFQERLIKQFPLGFVTPCEAEPLFDEHAFACAYSLGLRTTRSRFGKCRPRPLINQVTFESRQVNTTRSTSQ